MTSAEEMQARVEAIELAFIALIERLRSAGFDPAAFKAHLRSVAAATTAASGDAQVAKALAHFERKIP
jgi:hypothetical protein